MMILVAASSIVLALFARWYQTHQVMNRRISGGTVWTQREIMDLLWEPTDTDFLQRAHRVNYTGRPLSDAALAALSQRANPIVLDLGSSQVTDAGLIHLQGMSNLRFLDLGGTRITDAGLIHLKTMSGLRGISLMETYTSADGLDKLQKELPNTKIWRR
jgi:hypothetical protein